jgi:uncharacterized protein YuzE
MKISYDPEVDALYIRFVEGQRECRTVRLNEEVALNIGEGEQLVGIEMLDAKEILGAGKVPAVVLEGLESAADPLLLHDKPAKKFGA